MGSGVGVGVVVQGGQVARDAGQSWMGRNKWKMVIGALFAYIMVARMLSDGVVSSS